MKRELPATIIGLTIVLSAVSPHARAAGPAPMDPDPYGIVTKPIPERTVVLSFDDSVVSHATNVAPLLKKLGFGGSFYISNFDGFDTRKDWHMTWEQIKSLSDDGFDVGNHTKGHGSGRQRGDQILQVKGMPKDRHPAPRIPLPAQTTINP
jgi:peptidoglycan-N-acetylglucosamine deacetylase